MRKKLKKWENTKIGKLTLLKVMLEKFVLHNLSLVLQAPKSNPRDARLFITFRPNKKILNEISITAGYDFNTKNSITAISGKNKYKFDIIQENFTWMASEKQEKKTD